MKQHFAQTTRFLGLDTHVTPQDLGEGYVAVADNLLLDGFDGIVRPGKQAQFPAVIGVGPVYGLYPYITPSQDIRYLWSAGGRVYWSARGKQTYQEILSVSTSDTTPRAFKLVSENLQIARAGQYAYAVDGRAPLQRINPFTGQAGPVGTLPPPGGGPGASLDNVLIRALGTGTTVTEDSIPGAAANLFTSTDFTDGSFWNPSGDYQNVSSIGGIWCSDGSEKVESRNLIANPAYATATTAHGKLFRLTFKQGAAPSQDTFDGGSVSLIAYDSAGVELAAKFFPFAGSRDSNEEFIFDFSSELATAEIASLRVRWDAPHGRNSFGGFTIYAPALYAYGNSFALTQDGSGVSVGPGTFPYLSGRLRCGGAKIRFDFGSNQDWSAFSHIALGLAYNALTVPGLRLRLALVKAGSPTRYVSNDLDIAADGSYGAVDVTSNDISTTLDAWRYLEVEIEDDLYLGSLPTALFQITNVKNAGNLSIGYAPYVWLVRQANLTATPNVFSIPGPQSNSIDPTDLTARGELAMVAASDSSATHIEVYRSGGIFTDGKFRQVATLHLGSDNAITKANSATKTANLAWNFATLAFTDNVPDADLLNTQQLPTGAATAPVGAQAICFWQGRLVLAKGSDIYLSWLIQDAAGAEIQFTTTNILTDPEAPIKGALFTAGSVDDDPVQRLIPFGTFLAVLKKRSVWLLAGDDPTNFTLQSYLINAATGCIAPNAAAIIDNHVWFLSQDGLHRFSGDTVDVRSIKIEKALNFSGDTALSNVARKSVLMQHGRRVFFFVPESGKAFNNVGYIFDLRTQGWTKLRDLHVTSACSIGATSDLSGLILGGFSDGTFTTGQIFELTRDGQNGRGTGDTKTYGGTATPVYWTLTSRAYGQEGGLAYFRELRPTRLFAHVVSGGNGVSTLQQQVTLALLGDGDAPQYKKAQYVKDVEHLRVDVPASVRGSSLRVQVSGATLWPLRVSAVGLAYAEGGFK